MATGASVTSVIARAGRPAGPMGDGPCGADADRVWEFTLTRPVALGGVSSCHSALIAWGGGG